MEGMIIQDPQTQLGLQTQRPQVLCPCLLGKPKVYSNLCDRWHAEELKLEPSAEYKRWVRVLLQVPLAPAKWGHQRIENFLSDPIPGSDPTTGSFPPEPRMQWQRHNPRKVVSLCRVWINSSRLWREETPLPM